MIISEVTAFVDLVAKVTAYADFLRSGWYTSSAELNEFPIRILTLSAKHKQWAELRRQWGQDDDEELNAMAKMATETLDREKQKFETMRKSIFKKVKHRAFPGQLTNLLTAMEKIVDAGPQHVNSLMQNADMIEKCLDYVPTRLPFGPDCKYIPVVQTIAAVQRKLEDADGRPVVTVHGGPGLGKTSLANYLALHYQKQKQQSADGSKSRFFPDGVFYLSCGEGAWENIASLQRHLLEDLGCGSRDQRGEPSGQRQEDDVTTISQRRKLMWRLAEQRVLIILDDIWERKVLEELVVVGKHVRYLITSQLKHVWRDAAPVKMGNPTKAEARRILAKYTEGLDSDQEIPTDVKGIIDEIIDQVDSHPLALANVGLGTLGCRAKDPEEWKTCRDNLRLVLQEHDIENNPTIYQTMIRMVEGLSDGERRLLFLMSSLNIKPLPEAKVKLFWNIINPGHRAWYNIYSRNLENKSLIETQGVWKSGAAQQRLLGVHNLRAACIQDLYTSELESIVSDLLSSPINAILIAPYLTERFFNDMAPRIQHLLRISDGNDGRSLLLTISGSTGMLGYLPERLLETTLSPFRYLWERVNFYNTRIPPSRMGDMDVLDLASRARTEVRAVDYLIPFLDPSATGALEEQARTYAQKVILKLICRRELDDESAAALVKLPHTALAMDQALSNLLVRGYWSSTFLSEGKGFSSGHRETSGNILAALCNNDDQDKVRPLFSSGAFGWILSYESEERFLSGMESLLVTLTGDADARLYVFRGLAWCERIPLWKLGKFPGFWERVLECFLEVAQPFLNGMSNHLSEFRDGNLLFYVLYCMNVNYQDSNLENAIMRDPETLVVLQKIALRLSLTDRASSACQVLTNLAQEAGNRTRIFSDEDDLQHLLDLAFPCVEPLPFDKWCWRDLIKLVGTLARADEVRKRIICLCPDIGERTLLILRLGVAPYYGISPAPDDWSEGDVLDWTSVVLRAVCYARAALELDAGKESETMDAITSTFLAGASGSACTNPAARKVLNCIVFMLEGRWKAYMDLHKYPEALVCSEKLLEFIVRWEGCPTYYPPDDREKALRMVMYAKTMLQDYHGALHLVNDILAVTNPQSFPDVFPQSLLDLNLLSLAERGILKTMAHTDLSGALQDLDKSLLALSDCWSLALNFDSRVRYIYQVLRHRSHLKWLLGDSSGAKADRDSAERLEERHLVTVPKYTTPIHLWSFPPRPSYITLLSSDYEDFNWASPPRPSYITLLSSDYEDFRFVI